MSGKREIRQYVEKCLEELGVKGYTFGLRGRHPEVRFEHRGFDIRYVFPGSPSDWRSFQNTRAHLRRLVRAAEGLSVPAGPALRSVLDVGSVLSRQLNHVGSCTGRFPKVAPSVRPSWDSCPGKALKACSNA